MHHVQRMHEAEPKLQNPEQTTAPNSPIAILQARRFNMRVFNTWRNTIIHSNTTTDLHAVCWDAACCARAQH